MGIGKKPAVSVTIVVKIGGTSMACEGGSAGKLLGFRLKEPTICRRDRNGLPLDSKDEVFGRLVRMLKRAVVHYGTKRVEHIAVSVPGMLKADGSFTDQLSNIPCFGRGMSLQKEIAQALSGLFKGREVLIDIMHDAYAAGLGEIGFRGTFPGTRKSVLFVAVGTGIGMCFLQDGQRFTGGKKINDLYGESAQHLLFTGTDDAPDYKYVALKTRGVPLRRIYKDAEDLESRTAGPAIALYARCELQRMKRRGDVSRLTAESLAKQMFAGERFARDVFCVKGRELGIGLAVLLLGSSKAFKAFVWPDHIVIGSGVAQAGNEYLKAVRAGFKGYLKGSNMGDAGALTKRIVLSRISDDTAREFYGFLSLQDQGAA